MARGERLKEAIEIARDALRIANANVCRHEDLTRGGVLWTICETCGAKWADDRGGFKPNEDAARLDALTDRLDAVARNAAGKGE